jgi:predicted RNA-binding Zn ribbon-like protein
MEPLFLGGHPAVDFLNTAFRPQGRPIEVLTDGAAFVDWLVAARLLDATTAAKLKRRYGGKPLDTVAAEARKLREWARDWLDRWHDADVGSYAGEVRRLNELLEGAKREREVVAGRESLQLHERLRIETPDELLTLLAEQIALLLTHEQPSLVKHCGGSGCTLSFLDRTKAHKRVFCSAQTCGNRAKVAAFRERQRGG